MHSWELITNLHAKKMLLCFLQFDWSLDISHQKNQPSPLKWVLSSATFEAWYWIASYPGLFETLERRAWYPLFAHVRKAHVKLCKNVSNDSQYHVVMNYDVGMSA